MCSFPDITIVISQPSISNGRTRSSKVFIAVVVFFAVVVLVVVAAWTLETVEHLVLQVFHVFNHTGE